MPSRRSFLHLSAGLATGYLAGGCELEGLLSFTTMSAEVTERSAVLWARMSAEATVYFEYGTDSSFAGSSRTEDVRVTADTDFTLAMQVTGLTPGTRYYYRPVSSVSLPVMGSVGQLKTAPEGAASCLFGWGADLLASHMPFTILGALAAANPDVLLMLGDTTYANHPTNDAATDLASFHRKHRVIRTSPELVRLLGSTPTYGTWDDHECTNDADRTHPLMEPARRAFCHYWPVRAANGAGDGLYRSFRWGSLVETFILDCRTFRDPSSDPNEPGKTMLGAVQKAWLEDSLRASAAPFKLLVSSVPFLAPFGDDAWFAYAAERDELKSFLAAEVDGSVTILSADFHLAWHLEDAEHRLHEIIVGPLGAWPFDEIMGTHVEEVRESGRFHLIDAMNYGLVHVDEGGGAPSLSISIHDASGAEQYRARCA